MKKVLCLSLSLTLLFLFGCGGDDDGDGDPGPTTPTVAVNSTVGSPSMANANDAVWNSVTATSVDVSGANTLKVVAGKSASIPSTVQIKAITNNDSLFMQFIWSDPDQDIWPNYFSVNDAIPPITFSWPGVIEHEDQLFVFFDGGTEFGWDVWNWRSLTTDAGGLAEGKRLIPDVTVPVSDAGNAAVATKNNSVGGAEPTYVSIDTSEFNADNNQPVMLLGGIIQLNATIPDGPLVRNTTGWKLGQRVPGWIIDNTLDNYTSLDEGRRNSRFDIRATSAYSVEQYTVVLARKMNTGFTDDVNLSVLSTVKIKIGIYDDQDTFELGSSNRGFTPEINLNF